MLSGDVLYIIISTMPCVLTSDDAEDDMDLYDDLPEPVNTATGATESLRITIGGGANWEEGGDTSSVGASIFKHFTSNLDDQYAQIQQELGNGDDAKRPSERDDGRSQPRAGSMGQDGMFAPEEKMQGNFGRQSKPQGPLSSSDSGKAPWRMAPLKEGVINDLSATLKKVALFQDLDAFKSQVLNRARGSQNFLTAENTSQILAQVMWDEILIDGDPKSRKLKKEQRKEPRKERETEPREELQRDSRRDWEKDSRKKWERDSREKWEVDSRKEWDGGDKKKMERMEHKQHVGGPSQKIGGDLGEEKNLRKMEHGRPIIDQGKQRRHLEKSPSQDQAEKRSARPGSSSGVGDDPNMEGGDQKQCSLCGRQYHSTYKLWSHQASEHAGEMMVLKCPAQCSFATVNAEHLKWHLVRCRQLLQQICSYCNEGFSSKQAVWVHQANVHSTAVKALACISKQCEFKTVDQSHLQEHQASCEFVKKTLCNICRLFCPSLESLYTHKAQAHADSVEVLKCAQGCNFITIDADHLKSHYSQCPALIVECSICNEKCMTKGDLYTHLATAHRRRMPQIFTCTSSCSFVSVSNGHRREHMKACPTLRCGHCNEQYSNEEKLNKHKEILAGPLGMNPHQCPFCSSSFTDTYSVWIHQARSHPDKVETFSCRCSFLTSNEGHLHMHLKCCPEGAKQY